MKQIRKNVFETNSSSVHSLSISGKDNYDYTQLDEELDLPEDVMNEVINRAVVIALENIESPRTSTKLQLNQLSE